MSNRQRLTRSTDRWLAGVCGGIAEFVGWKPSVVRTLWFFGSVLSFGIGGIVLYTILALVMPPPDPGSKFNIENFRVQ